MSIIEIISLFAIMVTLAMMPSTSVALVITRSATLGVANGVAVAAGIILGDLIFIMLAILGLSVVAETMGGLFMVIKYIGAAYLLWLGFSLLTEKSAAEFRADDAGGKGDIVTSFLAGLFLTLGDIKAIFFYISLFPTFMDLSTLRVADMLVIFFITVVGVGGVKILYALSAKKVASMSTGLRLGSTAKKAAGGFMIGAGGYLIAKT